MTIHSGIGHNGGPRLLEPGDNILWAPQEGPQALLVTCPVFEVMFGGARGGGKTDGMLGDWLIHADLYGKHANGIMFRRTLVALEETIQRARELFEPLGAKFSAQAKSFRFPNGARIKFRFLERDEDADRYQGHSYSRIFMEELTQWPSPTPILKLMATLRSAHGVPCGFRATANPGGPGHLWVKQRYIDPDPAGMRVLREYDKRSGMWMERIFIPSKVQDNRLLMINDPFYVARLGQSGSEALVKAWLEGDWTVIEGAFFDCWSAARHVVKPHPIPESWTKFRSFDWGSASPFSVGWWAVSDGMPVQIPGEPSERWPIYPKGALIRYREWYGSPNHSNTGLKLTNHQIGEGIRERTPAKEEKQIAMTICDPSIFKQDGGPSIAEQMYKGGKFLMRPADNQRVAGWGQLRARMLGDEAGDFPGKPMIYFFETCTDAIRTIPALQHDETNMEDIDTDGEDHAGDETRYMCMARPYSRKLAPRPGALQSDRPPTMAEVIAAEQGGGTRTDYRSI